MTLCVFFQGYQNGFASRSSTTKTLTTPWALWTRFLRQTRTAVGLRLRATTDTELRLRVLSGRKPPEVCRQTLQPKDDRENQPRRRLLRRAPPPRTHRGLIRRVARPAGKEVGVWEMSSNPETEPFVRWVDSIQGATGLTWQDLSRPFGGPCERGTYVNADRKKVDGTQCRPQNSFNSFLKYF